MSNLITPTTTSKIPEPSKEILDEISKLNEQLTTKNGEWRFLPEYGIVWQPTGDLMGGVKDLQPPTSETPCQLLKELVEIGKTVDFDNLPENSVVLIKLNTDNPMRFQILQRGIATSVLDPRIEMLKKKKICILFIQTGEDISIMTEEEMNQVGWEKKEKSRIITL